MAARQLQKVQRFSYETQSLSAAEDHARYRDLTLPLYDIHVLDPSRSNCVEVVHIHGLMLVHGQVAPVRNERSERRVRSDGVDQIIVSCILEGDSIMETEGRRRVVPAQHVQFYDLARTAAHEGQGAPSISLVVPRDMFEKLLSDLGPLHGLVLGPLNDLIVQHLESLARHGATLPAATAAGVARATVELLCAAVSASPAAAATSPGAPAQVMRQARTYIADHLGEITPERLAGLVGVSRTRLYEAFAPYGGVSNYIRDSRLRAVRRALLDSRERRKVGELAFAHGFKSEAHFSRVFRNLFGVAPQALRRDLGGAEEQDAPANSETVRRWLKD